MLPKLLFAKLWGESMFVDLAQRLLIRATFCTIMLAISSCAIVGDGVVLVEGKLRTPSGQPIGNCEIELLLTNYGGSYGKHTVFGDFRVSYVIGGEESDYYFIVYCSAYDKTYKTKSYTFRGNTYDKKPLNIGEIVMDVQL